MSVHIWVRSLVSVPDAEKEVDTGETSCRSPMAYCRCHPYTGQSRDRGSGERVGVGVPVPVEVEWPYQTEGTFRTYRRTRRHTLLLKCFRVGRGSLLLLHLPLPQCPDRLAPGVLSPVSLDVPVTVCVRRSLLTIVFLSVGKRVCLSTC